ncbi:uncharacterized protein LOC111446759 [Cucurbita moschata]|uniref:Uncharacterized protein LOC111446759 n=1 Tax=Cucurbita moschata TaxID=3662 RepID=A0A6J1FL72_CUCMO|nr:uncharacterized protein LOC111446759 [Cucurbita moschata]
MDASSVHNTPPVEEDEWDTDGFVIPNLGIEGTDQTKLGSPEVEIQEPPPKAKEETTIYLGPHGAPPSQSKQQYSNPANRKQRLKQKLKEADRRTTTGRENKLENLRELVGGGRSSMNIAKGSSRDWLDPHCHEAQFQK